MNFLVAKRNAYGTGKEAFKLVVSYFNNRKERVKITERTIMWYTRSICVGDNPFYILIYIQTIYFYF